VSNNINILFAGDFAPCSGFEAIVLEKKEAIFGDALPLIQSSDMAFINLECPLTSAVNSISKSGPPLKSDPKCIESLKDFSLIGLANNHIMDFNELGLKDTLEACASINVKTVGAGINLKEAQKIQIIECDGFKVAVIALAEYEFNQASKNKAGSAPIDVIDNYHQIEQAKKEADMIIVTLHAGNEYLPYPRPNLRKTCKHYIDLGVDAVVCHHPHVPGAYEYHNGKPIFYSIGNIIFDNIMNQKDWEYGFLVNFNIDKNKHKIDSLELFPYKQSVELEGLKLLENEEKEVFLEKIEKYKQTLENDNAYEKEWANYVKKHANIAIVRQYSPFLFKGIGLLARKLPLHKLFYNKTNMYAKINGVRCQSHYELLKDSLEFRGQLNDK